MNSGLDHNQHLDTEERKQEYTLLVGENRLLEMVAKGESLPSILDGICRLVEDVASGCFCSILLLDANGDRLVHGAAPSLPFRVWSDTHPYSGTIGALYEQALRMATGLARRGVGVGDVVAYQLPNWAEAVPSGH